MEGRRAFRMGQGERSLANRVRSAAIQETVPRDKIVSRKFRKAVNQRAGEGTITKVVGGILSREDIVKMAVCDLTLSKGDERECLSDIRMGPRDPSEECGTCSNKFSKCRGHMAMMSIPPHAWFVHPSFISIVASIMNIFCFACFKESVKLLNPTGNENVLPEAVLSTTLQQLKTLYGQYKNVAGLSRLKTIAGHVQGGSCRRRHNCSTFKKSTKEEGVIIEQLGSGSDAKTDEVSVLTMRQFLTSISNYIEHHELGEIIGTNYIRYENFIITVIPVIPTCNRPARIINGTPKESDFTTLYRDMLKKIRVIVTQPPAETLSAVASLREMFGKYIADSGSKTGRNNTPKRTLSATLNGKKGLFRSHIQASRVDNSGRTVIVGDTAIGPNEVGVPETMAEKFRIRFDVTHENVDVIISLIESNTVKILVQNPKSSNRSVIHITEDNRGTVRPSPGDFGYRSLVDGDVVVINRQPTLWRHSVMSHRAVIMGKSHTGVSQEVIHLNTAYVSGYNADFDGDEAHIHVPSDMEARAQAALLMAVENTPVTDQRSVSIFGLIQNSVWGAYEMTKNVRRLSYEDFQILAGASLRAELKYEEYNVIKRLEHLKTAGLKIIAKYGKSKLGLYNTRTILSLAFPTDFSYRKGMEGDDPVVIENGILVSGTLSKSTVGNSANSIVQIMSESHGPQAIVIFIFVMQNIIDKWMKTEGLTISMSDFMPSVEVEAKIDRLKDIELKKAEQISQGSVIGVFDKSKFDDLLVRKLDLPIEGTLLAQLRKNISFIMFKFMLVESNLFRKGRTDVPVRVESIERALDKAIAETIEDRQIAEEAKQLIHKDIESFIVDQMNDPFAPEKNEPKSAYEESTIEADTLDSLDSLKSQTVGVIMKSTESMTGSLVPMIDSGARGKKFNLAQASAMVGNQTMSGQRLPAAISGGRRVFPFHLERDKGPIPMGTVVNPFGKGLAPEEIAATYIPSRQTQTDTSLGTGTTGYAQRRMMASMSDMKVRADGSVRNEKGEVICWIYGGAGFDAGRMLKVGRKFQMVNLKDLVREVDAEYESSSDITKRFFAKF